MFEFEFELLDLLPSAASPSTKPPSTLVISCSSGGNFDIFSKWFLTSMVNNIFITIFSMSNKLWWGWPSGLITPPLFKGFPGSKPPSDLSHTKCEERICQRPVILGKKAKESQVVVTSKERTRVTLIDKSTYSVGPLCFAYKPIPYGDSKHICLSTINSQ